LGKPVAAIIGVSANIYTHYGSLCGEGTGITDDAFSQAGAMLIVSSDTFVQVGYVKLRNHVTGLINKYIYAEMWTPSQHLVIDDNDIDSPPNDGETHTYEIHLNGIGGAYPTYDGHNCSSHFFSPYLTGPGNAAWQGEVLNEEDRFPGSNIDHCVFSSCQVNQGSGYVPAGITQGDLSSISIWGAYAYISGTSFSIWDIRA
jgi:hypothetical protein